MSIAKADYGCSGHRICVVVEKVGLGIQLDGVGAIGIAHPTRSGYRHVIRVVVWRYPTQRAANAAAGLLDAGKSGVDGYLNSFRCR